MYRRLILILAYCFCTMAVLASPAQTKQTISTLPNDKDIDLLRVVVLDVSGSMDSKDTKPLTRMGTARKEIKESLTQLPLSGKTPVILVPFCHKILEDFERIYFSTKAMADALDQIKPDGRTNIAAGLGRAIERINQLGLARNLVIYLYSDGEHNWGSKKLLEQQEDNLDRLFGFRASKGLSQTVVVKRWGGVISKLVTRLKKNPYVTVVDAGQLELRTVTLVPSVKLRSVKWHDAASGLAKVQFDVTVTNRSELTLPGKSTVKISCPLPGCRWLNESTMIVTDRTQTQTFTLLVELDPKKFNSTKNYSLPLQFHWPSQITTGKSLLVPVVNPILIYCALPAGQLRPNVTISAKLSEQGKPRWEDMDECIVVWPMRLRLETKTTPSFAWLEQVRLNIYGLNGAKVTTNSPIILQGQPKEVDISLTKKIPLEQVIQGKPVVLQIELRVLNEPKTLALSSVRILSVIRIELPAIKLTRIDQRISLVGKPQWADLTTGLVSVPVKLDIRSHGIVAPGTVLTLEPCGDVVKVDGTPVTIYSGQHTVDIILTGRVDCANSSVRWSLQLKPPLSSSGIRYIKPPPVSLLLGTQSVYTVPNVILSNLSCFWMAYRPIEGYSLEILSKNLTLNYDQADYMMEMPLRYVVCKTKICPKAFLADVGEINLHIATEKEMAERREETQRILDSLLEPEPDQPSLFSEKLSLDRLDALFTHYKLTKAHLDYLELVVQNPLLPVTKLNEISPFTSYKSDSLRDQLANTGPGLLQTHRITTGKKGGPLSVVVLTGAGQRIVDKLNIKHPEPLGHGGVEHKFWQCAAFRWAVGEKGFPAKIEKWQNGKSVDVGVEWHEKKVALEIALNDMEKELNNLVCDLEAGWDQVIFCILTEKERVCLKDKIDNMYGGELFVNDKVGFMKLSVFLECEAYKTKPKSKPKGQKNAEQTPKEDADNRAG